MPQQTNDLSSRALIDVIEARRFVWRDENDADRDDILIDAINDVSDAIADYCEREFTPTTAAETRTFRVTATGYVDLRPSDLRQLNTATLYPDRSDITPAVLTAADYQLTIHRESGTAYDLRIGAPAYQPLVTGFETLLAIAGLWGMAAVPSGVKLAAKQWVKNIAENPGSYGSQSMSGFTVIPETDLVTITPGGMPAAVRYRLDAWRRGFEFR
jgi:hypothetical protein